MDKIKTFVFNSPVNYLRKMCFLIETNNYGIKLLDSFGVSSVGIKKEGTFRFWYDTVLC